MIDARVVGIAAQLFETFFRCPGDAQLLGDLVGGFRDRLTHVVRCPRPANP